MNVVGEGHKTKGDKDKEIEDIIEEIWEKQTFTSDDQNSILNKFKEVYKDGYRHKYSEISAVIIGSSKNFEEIDEKREIINQNLRSLIEKLKGGEDDSNEKNCVLLGIEKLYDHLNLELVRLSEFKKLENENKNLQESTKNLQNENKNLQGTLKKLQEKIENSQTQYVTILSIFATIITSFVGNIAFNVSALSNINKINDIYSVAVLCFLVFCFINVFLAIFYFLCRITGRDFSRPVVYVFNGCIMMLSVALICFMQIKL